MVVSGQIRPLSISDANAVLALNAANETETAPMDKAELEAFLAMAFYSGAAGDLDGFCLAMDQDAPYDSPNFNWFAKRYERFVYVDRIIVAAHARGRGAARALYEDLFRASRRAGHFTVCCEVNLNPPNPASDSFHSRLGFSRIGQGVLSKNGKSVSYWIRKLPGL